MRIEQYTSEIIDLAYDTMEIKFYKEPEGDNEFGKLMVQELVFYNDYMLYHLSDADGEDLPIFCCRKLWYEDIEVYDFDCDNSVLTLKFYDDPHEIQIFADLIQLEKIYQIITTIDEKFVVTDFDELNAFFQEILENK
jgi:hypothetical protein